MYLFTLIVLLFVAFDASVLASSKVVYDEMYHDMDELKKGVAKGFSDQWNILQNIRWQGIKRHKGIVEIYQAINKLTQEIDHLKKTALAKHDDQSSQIDGQDCLLPWERVGRKCVRLFTGKDDRISWSKAQKRCRLIGGELLEVHTVAQMEELSTFMSRNLGEDYLSYKGRYVWIGVKFQKDTWKWQKNSNQSFNSKFWASKEPRRFYSRINTKSHRKKCVALDASKHFKAITVDCKLPRKFACEI